MTEPQKTYMLWDKFDENINKFIHILTESNFIEDSVILALKRGAFPSATALSNNLDIPISTIAFQTRDGDDPTPTFLEPNLIKNHSKFIVVDDIYDTGYTVETMLSSLFSDYGINSEQVIGLFHYGEINQSMTLLKHYIIMESNKGNWVVFPWEKKV